MAWDIYPRVISHLTTIILTKPLLDLYSQLRASSHTLQIERGWYTKPRTPVNEIICIVCQCLEDELHFVTACSVNQYERDIFYNKVCQKFPEFSQLDDVEKFIFLFTFDDAQTLPWLGKYLYKSFEVRASLYTHWSRWSPWRRLCPLWWCHGLS